MSRRTPSGTQHSSLERILEAVDLLRTHPEIGRPGRVVGTRELVVPLQCSTAARSGRLNYRRRFARGDGWAPGDSSNQAVRREAVASLDQVAGLDLAVRV